MKSFQCTQIEFTRHLRAPDSPAPQGLDDKRMGIYRDLVYNNIAGFIAGAFPIIKQILPEPAWHAMVRDFIARHESKTPYFLEISQEFLAYLTNEGSQHPRVQEYPFLLELAHYEWVELALDVATEELPPVFGGELAVMDAHPRVSPLAWELAYQFPVHKIGPGFCPTQAVGSPIFLIAYRNRSDHVKFMEINAMTYGLLQLLQEDSALTAREALAHMGHQFSHPNPQQLLREGELLLQKLIAADIIIGVQ